MKDSLASLVFRMPPAAEHDRVGWSTRHLQAVECPRTGFEGAFVGMIKGWLAYADAHTQAYASNIGDDCILGPAWRDIGASLRVLLNGHLGRLDAGTLDRVLCDAAARQGFDPDAL